MSIERVKKPLIDLGLSDVDIQVYVFLSINGPHNAREIAKKMALLREQIYRSLRNMQKKNTVKANNDYPVLFTAVPFEELVMLLANLKKEEAQSLRDSREQLLSNWQKTIKKKVYETH